MSLSELNADAVEAIAGEVAHDLANFAGTSRACATAARLVWWRLFLKRWPAWRDGMCGKLFTAGMGSPRDFREASGLPACPEPTHIRESWHAHGGDDLDRLSYATSANGEGLFIATATDRVDADESPMLYMWGARFSVLEKYFSTTSVPSPRLVAGAPLQVQRLAMGHGDFAVITASGELWLTHLAPASAQTLRKQAVPFAVADASLGCGEGDFILLLGEAGELAAFGGNRHAAWSTARLALGSCASAGAGLGTLGGLTLPVGEAG